MKIIKNKKDIETLKLGDQYIIEPKGLDYQDPLSFFKVIDEMDAIQKAIEKKFSSENIDKKVKTKNK